ncbi:MAG: hypothetical protein EBS96_11700, partial [Spartobacteria bacterium]|nr:hypothetical protein [Spartobacteria bacterium]
VRAEKLAEIADGDRASKKAGGSWPSIHVKSKVLNTAGIARRHEGEVQRAIRLQAGQAGALDTIVGGELASDEKPAIGLAGHHADRAICALRISIVWRGKALIECAIFEVAWVVNIGIGIKF